MKGVKIGQIQWICFWAMACDPRLAPLWIVSLFFDDKDL